MVVAVAFKAMALEQETADSLFERLHGYILMTGMKALDEELQGGLRTGDVVELVGTSRAGKTETLLHAAVSVAFPQTYNGVELGGGDSSVIYFDLDYHVSGLRLLALVQARARVAIEACTASAPANFLDELTRLVLERIQFVRCRTALQFLASLQSIPDALQLAPGSVPVRLLVVDSISAFHWEDRVAGEQGRRRQAAVVSALRSLAQEHHMAILAAKQSLYRAPARVPQGDTFQQHREFLGGGWEDLVRHRFAVTPDSAVAVSWQEGACVELSCSTLQRIPKTATSKPGTPYACRITDIGVETVALNQGINCVAFLLMFATDT